MQLLVEVIETNSHQVLYQCSLEDVHLAYQYAEEMEQLGLDVQIKIPSVTQTLAHGLGYDGEDLQNFEESVQSELEDHEGRCCE